MRKVFELTIGIGAILITVGIYISQVRRNTKEIGNHCISIHDVTMNQAKLQSRYDSDMPWIRSGLTEIKAMQATMADRMQKLKVTE